MIVNRGYKTEIDPNNKQRTLLIKNAGAARFAYNWALNLKQLAFKDKTKIPNAIELHRELNELKKNKITLDVRSQQMFATRSIKKLRYSIQ